jgi:hypothetical protein
MGLAFHGDAVQHDAMTTPVAVLTFSFDELAPEQLFTRDGVVDTEIAHRSASSIARWLARCRLPGPRRRVHSSPL